MRRYEAWVSRAAHRFGLQVSRISSRPRLPVEATPRDTALIESLAPFTMTSGERLWSLLNAVRYVIREDILGDFVECGVWRGGSVMAMASQLRELGVLDRRIWLYDTFTGMTDPTSIDIEESSGTSARAMLDNTPFREGNNVWCVAGRTDVEANVTSTGYPFEFFTFVEGDVVDTLPQTSPTTIALLRLDTDWYESTRTALEVLYPRLAVGGVCILDDYGHWQGARRAVDEYFDSHGWQPFMHPIDYSGRIFIKPGSHR